MIVRRYSPSDPHRVAARADFVEEHEAAGRPLFGAEPVQGLAWTLTADTGLWAPPLACAGLEPLGHDRWSAWLYAADLSPRGWAEVARATDRARRWLKVRRLELAIRAPRGADDWPAVLRSCAFAERLGLSREGVMRGWGPDGRDYWLYGGVF
jgi:hypothetical protein